MENSLQEENDGMKQISSSIQKAAKKSTSEILKMKAKSIKRESDPETENKCKMVHMLVDEGLEMYESGDMEFKEMIDDLYEALKAI